MDPPSPPDRSLHKSARAGAGAGTTTHLPELYKPLASFENNIARATYSEAVARLPLRGRFLWTPKAEIKPSCN